MDYEALRFIWWVLIGVLLIGFVVTDGFDMGGRRCSRSWAVMMSSGV